MAEQGRDGTRGTEAEETQCESSKFYVLDFQGGTVIYSPWESPDAHERFQADLTSCRKAMEKLNAKTRSGESQGIYHDLRKDLLKIDKMFNTLRQRYGNRVGASYCDAHETVKATLASP